MKLKYRYINILIIIFYFISNLILLNFHEMWRDEAQPWGIAVYSTLSALWEQLRVEGCPIFWFLIQRFLNFIGLRFHYLGYVTLFFTTISVCILLFWVNLPYITKICMVFSSVLFYYNPVIARNYAIVIFLIIILMSTYKNENKLNSYIFVLSVFLLYQTNIYTLGICIALTIEVFINFLHDKNKYKTKLIILILSGFISFISLIRWPNQKTFITVTPSVLIKNMLDIKRFYFAFFGSMNTLFDIGSGFSLMFTILIMISLIFIFYNLYKNRKILLIIEFIMMNTISIFMLCIVKGGGPINNIICCFFIFLFSLYIIYVSFDNEKIKKIIILLLTLLPFLTFGKMVKDCIIDIKNNYSMSKITAEYVNENLPKNSIILYRIGAETSPILAYIQDFRDDILNVDIYNQEEFLYHTWDKNYEYDDKINQYVKKLKKENSNIYFIDFMENKMFDDLKIVADFKNNFYSVCSTEKYIIYRFE